MGRISQRLVRKFHQHGQHGDDELRRNLKEFAATLSDSAPTVDRLLRNDYDPLHVEYIVGHEFVLMFSDAMPEDGEFAEYFEAMREVQQDYLAETDETTPVTGSYFSLWTLFDLRFGPDGETMGSCLLDVLNALMADPRVLRVLGALSASRMGVYQHQGTHGPYVQLRELVTGQELRCLPTSGHMGQPGELWFVRLGPPGSDHRDCHVTLTTPYVLTEASVDDWTAYLNKSLLGNGSGEPRSLYELLKFGKSRTAWLEFVIRAFQHADSNAVYLAGLPDVPLSLPNARCITRLEEADWRPAAVLAQERVPLRLTISQQNALASLLPQWTPPPKAKAHRPVQIEFLRLDLQRVEQRAPDVIGRLKGVQRKPYQKLLEMAVADRRLATGELLYRLRIELDGTRPAIWRQIEVHDCMLDDLHLLIQAAMGWENEHLYQFESNGVFYVRSPEEPLFPEAHRQFRESENTFLTQVVPAGIAGHRFRYVYDLGDDWYHTVTVESLVEMDDKQQYPICLAGGGACPPEDCGGVYRFNALCHALSNRHDEWHDDARMWLGSEARMRAFNVTSATRRMRRCFAGE